MRRADLAANLIILSQILAGVVAACLLATPLNIFAAFTKFKNHDLPTNASDELVAQLATTADSLVRITDTPHEMADSTASLCLVPVEKPHRIHDGFLEPAFCHVYVSKDAELAIRTGDPNYPVGAIIVKSKFAKGKQDRPVLFTVMRKMQSGYDTNHGDWEYSIVDGTTRRVQARGRIDSCIQCHAEYKETGYVTREYMRPISR